MKIIIIRGTADNEEARQPSTTDRQTFDIDALSNKEQQSFYKYHNRLILVIVIITIMKKEYDDKP